MEWKPFFAGGRGFQPLVYLERVDLPEFGCEGRPETGEAAGAVWGSRPDGRHLWRIGEAALLASGFCDDLWIGWQDGALVLVSQAEDTVCPAVAGTALDTVLREPGLLL